MIGKWKGNWAGRAGVTARPPVVRCTAGQDRWTPWRRGVELVAWLVGEAYLASLFWSGVRWASYVFLVIFGLMLRSKWTKSYRKQEEVGKSEKNMEKAPKMVKILENTFCQEGHFGPKIDRHSRKYQCKKWCKQMRTWKIIDLVQFVAKTVEFQRFWDDFGSPVGINFRCFFWLPLEVGFWNMFC